MEKSDKDTLNIKHNLSMEVLTPLHVGAGAEKDWIKGSDFIVEGGKVKVLNINKVASVIGVENLTNALLKKDDKYLKNKLAGNLNDCVEKEFNVNFFGSNDIKTFIKNGLTDKPIVPGSSVKGALRSIVLESLFTKNQINGAIDRGKINERSLFGQADKGDELFRFIKISDASFSDTKLCNTKIFNLSSTEDGGWKHGNFTDSSYKPEGFNTFYEIVPISSKSIISLNIAEIAFKNYGDKVTKFSNEKEQFIKSPIQNLFRIINQHTKNYLEKEKAFFEKYNQAENTDKIIDSIDNLLGLVNQAGDKYCILKMAAGSGFHSITGDWQFDDYSIDRIRENGRSTRGTKNGKDSAKSRKIAIHDGKFELMGFVKLSLASDEEFSKNEALLRKSVNELNSMLIAKKAEKVRLAAKLQAQKEDELRKKEEEDRRIAEELAKAEAEKQAAIEAQIAEERRIEEERKQEEERKLALIQQVNEDLKKQKEEKQQLASQGFQTFYEANNTIDFKKFKDLENFTKRYLSNLNSKSFPESDWDFLKGVIEKIYSQSAGFECKQFSKSYLRTISNWVGSETANKWFEKLSKL